MKRATVALVLGTLFLGTTASAVVMPPPWTPNLASWTTTNVPSGSVPGGSTFPVAFLNGAFYGSGGTATGGAAPNCTAGGVLSCITVNTSADGLTWRQGGVINPLASPTPPVPPAQLSIAYQNGTYATGLANGEIETSKDGVTWTLVASTTNQPLTSVACGAGTCVFGGGSVGVVAHDSALASWTRFAFPSSQYNVLGLAYGAGLFVAVTQTGCAGCGPGTGVILTSADGTHWKVAANSTGLAAITYGASGFVGVGLGGGVSMSPDGVTWTNKVIPGTTADLKGVAFGDNTYVAAGTGASVFTMGNGLAGAIPPTWTSRAVNAPGTIFYNVAFGANRFVAYGWSTQGSIVAVTSASFVPPATTLPGGKVLQTQAH